MKQIIYINKKLSMCSWNKKIMGTYGRLTTVFSITGWPIRKRHYLTPMMPCSWDKLRLRVGLLSTHL